MELEDMKKELVDIEEDINITKQDLTNLTTRRNVLLREIEKREKEK